MTTSDQPQQPKPMFILVSEHQMAFDALKITLTTAPVLGYPGFTKEFIYEADASLEGMGAVLSQEDNIDEVCVLAYVSWTLRPAEQTMHNYSSAKEELFGFEMGFYQQMSGLFA